MEKGNQVDVRFSHVASDPRFKPLRAKKSFISQDDDRFKDLLENSALHKTVDPRGRKFNIKSLVVRKDNLAVKRRRESEELESHKKSRGEHDAGSDSGESQQAAQQEEESSCSEDSDDEGYNNDAVEQYVHVDEDPDLIQKMYKDIEMIDEKKPMTELDQRRMKAVLDPNRDIVRCMDSFSDSEPSTEEDSSSSEEEEEEYDWGQLDKEALWDTENNQVQETKRLAVCNLEWDLFNVQDIFVVLNSFAPKGGKVCQVSVYLSEFGKERLAEEQKLGPKEVRDLPSVAEEEDNHKDHEAMRKFNFNRLKYYYAIAECDSVMTARVIYQNLDGKCFRNGGIVDLRYVPDQTTFDETPESVCSSAPAAYSYSNSGKFMSTNYSKTKFDWDDDLDLRKTFLQKFVDADEVKDNPALNDFVALDSEDDSDAAVESCAENQELEFTSNFENVQKISRNNRVDLYRDLMANIHTFDRSKEHERELYARAFGDDAADVMMKESGEGKSDDDTHMEMEVELDSDEEDKNKQKSTENLTSHEKYLIKRDEKQKQRKKAKKEAVLGKKVVIEKEDADIPDELKNDPLFKEDLRLRRKEQLKLMKEQRDAQDSAMAQEELSKAEREKEMALLMLDDDDSTPRGVDMREVVKEAKMEASSKKRLSRWKLSKLKIKEKRLAKQGVVLDDVGKESSTLHSKDTALSAAAVVKDDRFAGIFENWRANLDPSHPEFSKHHTPFMDDLVQQIQVKARTGKKTKKNRIGN
ncbi:NUC153 [Trinorchestia longiramus]|nr:NUC153 [Trinorchestia longiramus]